jgi:hypothetical protein
LPREKQKALFISADRKFSVRAFFTFQSIVSPFDGIPGLAEPFSTGKRDPALKNLPGKEKFGYF